MTSVNKQVLCWRRWLMTALLSALPFFAANGVAAGDEAHEESGHRANHLAFIVGHAEEEQSDGHHESGSVLGLDYIRHLTHRWGIGATFEMESFGDNHKRYGILAFPVSYYPGGGNWRLFAAPGVEFDEPWDPEKAILRIGVGYNFHLDHRWSISPEAQVDFVEGGTTVYVFALAFGVAF